MNTRLNWNTAVIAISLAAAALTCAAQTESTGTTVRARRSAPVTVYSTPTVQSSSVNVTTAASPTVLAWRTADDKRVDLDLNNASLKDALKQLFDQAKYEFSIDGDAPDTRITVHAKNVRFSTALGLITEAAGVNWKVERKDKSTHYTIGKSLKSSHYWSATPWVLDGKSNLIYSNNKPFTLSTTKGSFDPLLFQNEAHSNYLTTFTSE